MVEPDLAMPAAHVLAVDDDVAALAVPDGVAAARNGGRKGDAATAVRIVDLDFQRPAGDGRMRNVALRAPVPGPPRRPPTSAP